MRLSTKPEMSVVANSLSARCRSFGVPSSRPRKRGFAVVAALVAVVVLTILAGAFAYSMKVETRLAANSNNDEQMLWLGRSGVELARYVLTLDSQQPCDCLSQIWAGGPGTGPETNSALMGLSLDNYPVGLPDPIGTVSLKIIDLERKININRAQPPQLQQVFTTMGVDANDISVLSDSILDWINPGDSGRPAGAESDYYQGLNPPYYAKNGPMDDLSELLLVKGVTPAMYFGTGSSDQPDTPFAHHKLGFNNAASGQEPDYPFGFTNVFTPFSSGQINLNTADLEVLELIPGMDTTSAQNILKFRAGPDGVDGTDDDTPFINVGQLASAGVNPQSAAQIGSYCTTRSSTFEVHVTARIGDQERNFVAIIFRNGPNTQIVRFYWE
jgi:type II secretory pathway component PulK